MLGELTEDVVAAERGLSAALTASDTDGLNNRRISGVRTRSKIDTYSDGIAAQANRDIHTLGNNAEERQDRRALEGARARRARAA